LKTWLAFFVLACCATARAHIGSPNIFVEDKAGEYPIRVVIRPPNVVPGLAEITVHVPEPVQGVTVLPVFWKAGRKGSPPPDAAKLVRGETTLYSAQLWLMKSGAYSVDVTIEGARGKGTLVVPVNSIATNTRPMTRGYSLVLGGLTTILFVGGMMIVGAIFGEARLDPGVLPTRRDRWRGWLAMAGSAGVLSLMLFGGTRWWDFEDRNYRNNALYRPVPVSAQVHIEREQPILTLNVDASARRGRWTPLIPDHGKLMHLFLVRDGEQNAFAHLHPVQRSSTEFEVPLPPLPAGQYHVYADITHEDGFAETLVAAAEIPRPSDVMKKLWLEDSGEPMRSADVAQMHETKLFLPPDPDDSWQMSRETTASSAQEKASWHDPQGEIAAAGEGYRMIWQNSKSITQNQDASLRFKLLTPDGQPAEIEPYMGMLGHAAIRRNDGAVFAHLHPVGTFSMAAQQFFVERKPGNQFTSQKQQGATSSTPSTEDHAAHIHHGNTAEGISFPYAFPQPGAYRLWVQMKSQGRILTGVFDTTVAAAK
jgi:hypothetical protein